MTTMTDPASWLELYRTADRREALTLAITIAAMEFEVRTCDRDGNVIDLSDAESDFTAPYLIQVRESDLGDLSDVLDSILDEQAEFDARLAGRKSRRERVIVLLLILLSLFPVALILFELLRGAW